MITMNTLWYISCFIVGFVAGVLIEATNYNRIRKMKDRERVVRYEERIDCMEKRMRELQENDNERFYIKGSILTEGSVILDKEHKYNFPVLEPVMNFMFKKALNELNDECEFLKTENESLDDAAKKYAKLYHQSFRDKVCSAIDKRINELENDYDKAVKAGMPSNGIYSEIELLGELKEEFEE